MISISSDHHLMIEISVLRTKAVLTSSKLELGRRDVTLVAARDIRAGEILFSVPPALQVASDKHGAEVAPLDFAEVRKG